jgi:pre-mRNA-splicing helicase BRR2
MAGSDEARAILDALNADRATALERKDAIERTIREEARRLRQETDRPGGGADKGAATAGNRKTVDLDSLEFAAGGHLMTNKNCNLPPVGPR